MDDALDFIAAPDYWIKLVLFRQVSQITTKCAERGSFDIFLGRLTAFVRFRGREIRVELFENLVPRPLDIDFETLEDTRRDAFTFAQKPKQNVFGADVGMIERFGFLAGEGQDFFHARRVGNVSDHLGFRSRANLLLHFHSHGLQIETHFLQNVHRHALPQLDQSQKQMLGADVIVVEAVGLLASERQDLLCPWCEIIHCSMARPSRHCPTPPPSY